MRAVGAARGCLRGAPPAWVWGVRGRALSHPRLPALWAGCRGPLPTGCGCGGVRVWRPVTNPTACAPACCGGGMRVPRGGASCLGVGHPGSGALRPPTACPLAGLPGPTTHWLRVRGGAGVATRHQPHSARSCELAMRAVGAARGRPGGAPPAWVWGVRGRALSLPRLPALWAGCRGPLPTGCGCGGVRAWGPVPNPTARALARCGGGMRVPGGGASCLGVGRPGSGALPTPTAHPLGGLPGPTTHWLRVRGGVRAWGPVTDPTAHALASWLCAPWGRHEGARGERLLPGCGASGVGRSPTPDCPPSARAAGPHYPLAVGAGGCGRGDPSSTPQRALMRAGYARCGGGTRAPRGAPPAWVWGVRGRALSHSRLPALWAGCRGPLPTGCGCGGVRVWGPVTNRTACAPACCGGGTRAPGGGASCLVVGRPGSGALPPPTARPLGGLPGPTTHWLWVRGGAGVGTRHQPHSARFCVLWGRHEGARGGASCLGVGRQGSGALSPPTARPLDGLPGPTTHWLWVRGVRAWGPVTNPTARALVCCEGSMRVPGGGAFCLGVGRPGSGALPPPTARPPGGLPGPTTHWLWVRGGCGCGDPSPTPQRALLRAGFARCGGGTRPPGGGVSCLGVGRPGSGALPSPTARPLGGLPGPTTHWLWVRGGGGMGTRHQSHSARSCVPCGLHEGAWGGRLLPGCGASGVGRSPTPDCPPSGRAAGAH